MTALLACVRDAAEAAAALDAGFDGVVGPAPAEVARWPQALVGRFDEDDLDAPALVFDGGEVRLAVAQNRCPDEAELAGLVGRCSGLLLRTSDRLVGMVTLPALAILSSAARRHGLQLALAGALEPPDVPRLLALGPTMLLFGRALRTRETLDARRLRAIVMLKPDGPMDAVPILRAGGRLDRIFVCDLVLMIEVGAYASERGRTQRVSFSVEAAVRPSRAGIAGLAAGDLDAVVSYDLITDAIQRLTVGRHVDLVETLAEDLATALLAIPRIAVVRVRVEKLDLGPRAVGVEIERRRG